MIKDASQPPLIDHSRIRSLSRLEPWRWFLAVLGDWALIVAVIAICCYWSRWYMWLAGILVVGNRQHALAVLMHEAVHYRVTSRRWSNDLLGDLLTGFPIGLPTANYRVFHLPHHMHLDTPRDPERLFSEMLPKEAQIPMPPIRFAYLVLRDLSGLWPLPLGVLARLIWGLPGQSRLKLIPILLLHGSVGTACLLGEVLHFYLFLWLLPLYTVFPAIFRIRAMTEHDGIEEGGDSRYSRAGPDVLRTTRSVRGALGRFLFGPHGINHHIEHHLYPSVPFYNLGRLSEALTQIAPHEVGNRIRTSYWSAIGECLTLPPGIQGRRSDPS